MGGKRRFKTCAIVGNAGFMLNHKLGQYIDSHEVVVRFNVMDVGGFTESVGSKTTFRMLNHQRSTTGCCRGKLPENSTNSNPITVVFMNPPIANQFDHLSAPCYMRDIQSPPLPAPSHPTPCSPSLSAHPSLHPTPCDIALTLCTSLPAPHPVLPLTLYTSLPAIKTLETSL
jgi:hypothetical protein